MARWPLETTWLIVEGTWYITIRLHRQCYSFASSVILILLKTQAVFFLKLGKLDNEVILTGREFQIFGPCDARDNYWLL